MEEVQSRAQYQHQPHDWHSPDYVDSWIAHDTTRDEDRRPVMRRAVGLLEGRGYGSPRVLDAAGGYGEFSAQVLEHLPGSIVVLADFSEPMLAHARQRLGRFGDRFSCRSWDMTQPDWRAALGGPFDAVVSSYALHHGGRSIRNVYAEVFASLHPGGAFVQYDLFFPTTDHIDALYAGAGDPDRQRPRGEAGPASLVDHLIWLAEVGFGDVDCVWKDLKEALLYARRPS